MKQVLSKKIKAMNQRRYLATRSREEVLMVEYAVSGGAKGSVMLFF